MVQYELEGKVYQVEKLDGPKTSNVARMTVLMPQARPDGEKPKVVVEYSANKESTITLPPMPKAARLQTILAVQWKFDRIVKDSPKPPHVALADYFRMRKARELQAEVNKK